MAMAGFLKIVQEDGGEPPCQQVGNEYAESLSPCFTKSCTEVLEIRKSLNMALDKGEKSRNI